MTTPPAGTLVVGIDPGGRETGITITAGRELLAAAILDRNVAVSRTHGYSAGAWAAANVEAVDRLLGELLPGETLDTVGRYVVAVEDVVAPNPHVTRDDGNALTNPDGILDTAIVLGAVLERWPDAIIVAPGGNGAKPRGCYPDAIDVPAGGKGKDRRRHARSAYDVAQAARVAAGRLHPEAQRAARIVEPVLYRVTVGPVR